MRSRSRSRWLKAIRSVSIAPSATYESGHFYFAQIGHSHFAATGRDPYLTGSARCVNSLMFSGAQEGLIGKLV
jgi:hypothetical protein